MELSGFVSGTWWQPGAVAISLRENGLEKQLTLTTGDELAFGVSEDRRCIGYRPPQQPAQLPCPDNAIADHGSQCAKCFNSRSAILQCVRCIGERCSNPKRRHDCIQPKNHAVYLASFGGSRGIVKVGVARWERRMERVAEQGARAGFIVGQADGLEARRLETQIRRLGLPDRLAASVRLGLWSESFEQDLLEGTIQSRLGELHRRLISPWWLPESEKLELPPFAVLSPMPQLLDAGAISGLRLRGTITALAGQTLVVQSDSGEQLAFDLKSLSGYTLRPLEADEHGQEQLTLALA